MLVYTKISYRVWISIRFYRLKVHTQRNMKKIKTLKETTLVLVTFIWSNSISFGYFHMVQFNKSLLILYLCLNSLQWTYNQKNWTKSKYNLPAFKIANNNLKKKLKDIHSHPHVIYYLICIHQPVPFVSSYINNY